MNDEKQFGDDYYTITDEEGNEYEIEHLDTLELDDEIYMSFLPVEDSKEPEMVIFKVVEVDGEELFATIDDEAELERVYEEFMNRLFELED